MEVITNQVAADTQKAAAINSITLTTETAPNLNITKRIEIVTAECAFGMNIFKDLFAGVRDIVGGRSEAVQKTMRDSRRTALEPPHLNWSSAMFRKRRTDNDEQTTTAGRDYHEVTAS